MGVLLELNTAFGIVANLADDLRNLQRSEIDEVREPFGSRQVGSSTMPQKRNPWNCEHVKSLWKAFAPRVMTFFMDQVSEHQRDLTNSASARFVPEFIAGLTAAANRMFARGGRPAGGPGTDAYPAAGEHVGPGTGGGGVRAAGRRRRCRRP